MRFCFFCRDEENTHPISCIKMTFFWTSILRKLKRLRPSTAQNIEFHGTITKIYSKKTIKHKYLELFFFTFLMIFH
jgi:hypothetical protein